MKKTPLIQNRPHVRAADAYASRRLDARSYPQLVGEYPRYARGLLWLKACRVITRADLEQVIWPEGVQRQTIHAGLKSLIGAALLESVDAENTAFQLGRRGAAITPGAIYRPVVSRRVLPGLLLASSFATALGAALMREPQAAHLSWQAQPFTGRGVRPDACGTIIWSSERLRSGLHPDILQDESDQPDARASTRIMLEIDGASERATVLANRQRAWLRAYDSPPESLSAIRQSTVLWVTTGSWRRVRTLCASWHPIPIRAFFTTAAALRHPHNLPHLSPFTAQWRDRHGQIVSGAQVFHQPQY